jgi:hypothetical protein
MVKWRHLCNTCNMHVSWFKMVDALTNVGAWTAILSYINLQQNMRCFLLQLEQSPALHFQPTGSVAVGFNPFIYGNDVDSVDVATRVAMVSAVLQPVGSGDRAVCLILWLCFHVQSCWQILMMSGNRCFQTNLILVHVACVIEFEFIYIL